MVLGGPAGGALGSVLGGGAGSLFHHITGFGDYKVSRNSILTDSVPMFNSGKTCARFTHREYIGDVISSATAGAFSSTVYPIQPGLVTSFPWLSIAAQGFEEVEIKGMVCEFVSNSADAVSSTNTALGSVIMATQYNPLAPAFVNKQQMEQYMFGISGKPNSNLMHPIECDRKQSQVKIFQLRYSLGAPGDLRLYDLGNFTIATQGMQGTSVNVGELWFTYDVCFYKPRLGNTPNVADHYYLGPVASITSATPFGTAPVLASTSSMGTTVTPGGTITFPKSFTGSVEIVLVCRTAAATVQPTFTFTATGGVSAAGLLIYGLGPYSTQGGGVAGFHNSVSDTASYYAFVVPYTVVGGGTVTVNQSATPVGGVTTFGDLFINSLPMSLTN